MKVIVRKLALRSSVDEHFHIEKWLKEGDEVTKVDKRKYYDGLLGNYYYQVKTKEGAIGFVRGEAIK